MGMEAAKRHAEPFQHADAPKITTPKDTFSRPQQRKRDHQRQVLTWASSEASWLQLSKAFGATSRFSLLMPSGNDLRPRKEGGCPFASVSEATSSGEKGGGSMRSLAPPTRNRAARDHSTML